MIIEPSLKRAWAEVDLEAVKYNFNVIRKAVGNKKICCIVKANAYGHGSLRLSRVYEELGADFLAVSNIEEALQLRCGGIGLPILILGYTDPECAATLADQNISQCVFSSEYGRALSESAQKMRVNVKIHIKIDTGMGRIGFQLRDDENEIPEALEVCRLPGLVTEGIFTHFASADEGDGGREYTKKQFAYFSDAVNYLESNRVSFSIRHCANSAAIFDFPEMHLDMVRAGVVLYGVLPSDELKTPIKLKTTLKLVTIIDHIKTVKAGNPVSYGREFVPQKDMKIATVPIGYADGIWCSGSRNKMTVEVCGKPAPIVGRICMDQCMIDISGIDEADLGSRVVVYGDKDFNSVDRVAKINGTINYEVLCAIGNRVPRIYI